MIAPPFSRVWTLLTLLTDNELRALFAQVQQELGQRHGAGAPVLVDVLTEEEARLVAHHRAAQHAAVPSPQTAHPAVVALDIELAHVVTRARGQRWASGCASSSPGRVVYRALGEG